MKKAVMLALVAMASMLYMHAGTAKYAYKTVEGDPMQTRIYTLDNGLTVYLSQNQESPVIQTYITVRAGSMDEPLESTGLAHYLEHMMFKGTKQYGTLDYEAESVYLSKIDSLFEVYRFTTDTINRKAIYHEIDSISYLSSQIAVANEFDKLMDWIGATGVNAYTSTDRTCYHEVIPAGELNRWAKIEADRFQNLVLRGFHTELETVYEEYNRSLVNDFRKVISAIDKLLYPELPYRQHTTLGHPEHLKNPSILNVHNFYDTYYRPNNVAICMSGDLDFDKTMDIIVENFGAWTPNLSLQRPIYPNVLPLLSRRDTTIYGEESPMFCMAWQLPAASHEDRYALEIMTQVLQNGRCGLWDIDLEQKQRVLGCAVDLWMEQDYSKYLAIGYPKKNQSLEDVRKLMLVEIDKLCNGEFSTELLNSIQNNYRRSKMEELQYNGLRAEMMSESFINREDWAETVHAQNRLAAVTKEDVVRVANKYLKQHYACIYKLQGEDKSINAVSKPEISPIVMNGDTSSARFRELVAEETARLEPQFITPGKDFTIRDVDGMELLYKHNNENELATLLFIIDKGRYKDDVMELANSYIDYIGTKEYSLEARSTKMYSLACDAYIGIFGEESNISISGLSENITEACQITMDWWLNAKEAKSAVYKNIVSDRIKSHEDAKTDQGSCADQLYQYGVYGEESLDHLTPAKMKKIKATQLIAAIKDLANYPRRVVYYGPMTEEEVAQMIHQLNLPVATKKAPLPNHDVQQEVKEQEVLVAPYNAANIYFYAYANPGSLYDVKDAAIISLFNEYFNGSMGSVVFQEIRESRALAYYAGAYYSTPSYAGETYCFIAEATTQTDKLQDCTSTFRLICDSMPISADRFETAKKALLTKIEKARFVRIFPMLSYINWEKMGRNYDIRKNIYLELQTLTLDDIVQFQKEYIANQKFRYMILGNKDELDMEYLKTLGPVKELTIDELFVY